MGDNAFGGCWKNTGSKSDVPEEIELSKLNYAMEL
jgi:hypothetical protein